MVIAPDGRHLALAGDKTLSVYTLPGGALVRAVSLRGRVGAARPAAAVSALVPCDWRCGLRGSGAAPTNQSLAPGHRWRTPNAHRRGQWHRLLGQLLVMPEDPAPGAADRPGARAQRERADASRRRHRRPPGHAHGPTRDWLAERWAFYGTGGFSSARPEGAQSGAFADSSREARSWRRSSWETPAAYGWGPRLSRAGSRWVWRPVRAGRFAVAAGASSTWPPAAFTPCRTATSPSGGSGGEATHSLAEPGSAVARLFRTPEGALALYDPAADRFRTVLDTRWED